MSRLVAVNEDVKLAALILASVRKDPEKTVDELAAEHDLAHAQVVRILDEYRVGPDGKIRHAGVGRGGGWIEA